MQAQERSADSAWGAGVPQRDVMDLLSRVLHGKPDSLVLRETPRPLVLALLPSFSVNPAFGVSLGVSANAFTRLGPEATTNATTVGASVSYTTKKQFNVVVRSNIFGNGNRFLLQGDWRYLDTSQPTYGLGPALPESQKDDIDFNGGQTITENTSSGLSVNLAFDSRDNPNYPTRGYYSTMSLKAFPTWMGSDGNWQSFQTDLRTYSTLDPRGRSVLALWATTWFTFGATPYMELPAIGWDTYARTGRGYPQGRIRGRNQIYVESEYRMTLSRDGLWGAVAFLSLLSTSDPVTTGLQRIDPGIGAGLRIKLNKRSRTNITLDFGFGAEGSKGLFMGSTEAF